MTRRLPDSCCQIGTSLKRSVSPPLLSLCWSLSVSEGPYSNVVKLQTMRCLFEAYEHVLALLESVFTPMFCHSDEVRRRPAPLSPLLKTVDPPPADRSRVQYFRHLLKGSESPTRSSRISRLAPC